MIINNNNIFNNLEFLTEQESYKLNDPYNIPITESGIIELDKILEFYCNNDSYEFEDCISSILESNNIDNFCVVINEEDVILEPSIVNLFENYVIKPISPYNKIYQECVDYTNELLNEEIDNMQFLLKKNHPISRSKTHNMYDLVDNRIINSEDNKKSNIFTKIGAKALKILLPYTTSDAGIESMMKKNILEKSQNPKYVRMAKKYDRFHDKLIKKDIKRLAIGGAGAVATGLSAAAIYKLAKKQKSPKSFIGKKIASFRKIYRNLMIQAQKNPKKAGMFKRVAAKILKVIDQLMAKLQNMAG